MPRRPRSTRSRFSGLLRALLNDPPAREACFFHRNCRDRTIIQQVGNVHLQAAGQGVHHGQRGIGFTGLDATKVSPEKTAFLGKVLLREAARSAKFTNTIAKNLLMGERHQQNVTDVH